MANQLAKAIAEMQTKRQTKEIWQNSNGTWSHSKDSKREWSDKVGCETDLRFAKEWAH
jgi:hypothetical protein